MKLYENYQCRNFGDIFWFWYTSKIVSNKSSILHYFRISRLIHSLFLPKTNAQYTKQEQRFFYVAFAKNNKKLTIFDAKILTPECCSCNGGLLYAIFLHVIFEELHILQLGFNNSQCGKIISEETVSMDLHLHKIFLPFQLGSFKFSQN